MILDNFEFIDLKPVKSKIENEIIRKRNLIFRHQSEDKPLRKHHLQHHGL